MRVTRLLAMAGAVLFVVPAVRAQEAPAPAPDSAARRIPGPTTEPNGARLRGLVTALADGKPLQNADIELVGLDTTMQTGVDGRFDFGLLVPGPYVVQAKLIGFRPYTVQAVLGDSSITDLVFKLSPQAVQLEEQVVEAKRRTSRFQERYEQNSGFGQWLTREQIEARNTPYTCDLLRGRSGLRITSAGANCSVRVVRQQGQSFSNSNCAPQLFVDGIRSDLSLLEQNSIPPSNIEGIEVYRGASEAPGEFSLNANCGVIALWTRVGS